MHKAASGSLPLLGPYVLSQQARSHYFDSLAHAICSCNGCIDKAYSMDHRCQTEGFFRVVPSPVGARAAHLRAQQLAAHVWQPLTPEQGTSQMIRSKLPSAPARAACPPSPHLSTAIPPSLRPCLVAARPFLRFPWDCESLGPPNDGTSSLSP